MRRCCLHLDSRTGGVELVLIFLEPVMAMSLGTEMLNF